MVSSTASTSTVHVLQTVASSQGKRPETAPTAHIAQPKITQDWNVIVATNWSDPQKRVILIIMR